MPRPINALAFAVLALGAATSASAETVGSARGQALAQEWCARCHAVTAAQVPPGETNAPPFRRIAANPKWTRNALIDMVTVPHMNMPPPVLTRAEAEFVADYILSLRK